MSLTPLPSDPNYKAEMLRKEREPDTFGSDEIFEDIQAKLQIGVPTPEHGGLIPNFAEYEAAQAVGAPPPTAEELAAIKAAEEAAEYAAKVKAWAEVKVADTVVSILAELPDYGTDHIEALIAAETAGQSRKTLLDALGAALKTGDK